MNVSSCLIGQKSVDQVSQKPHCRIDPAIATILRGDSETTADADTQGRPSSYGFLGLVWFAIEYSNRKMNSYF